MVSGAPAGRHHVTNSFRKTRCVHALSVLQPISPNRVLLCYRVNSTKLRVAPAEISRSRSFRYPKLTRAGSFDSVTASSCISLLPSKPRPPLLSYIEANCSRGVSLDTDLKRSVFISTSGLFLEFAPDPRHSV